MTGAELQANIADMVAAPQPVAEKLAALLGNVGAQGRGDCRPPAVVRREQSILLAGRK